jgi:prolyl oligopeptidase
MTAYGGYGISMTPKFSVFVMLLVEFGCLFALPQIRGGSEQGGKWQEMGRRRNREKPIEDFIAAAEWLIRTGRTTADQLATFGGSNSGLLVIAAMIKRPELFCAVLSIAPLLDMLRYHLFDSAHAWTDEFGTSEDPDDFATLVRYSPYQNVRESASYPSVLFVSGDLDRTSNALHVRKMTARLQAASSSRNPILIDYNEFRGHAPVLPLSTRIGALTDRIAFVADRLKLWV